MTASDQVETRQRTIIILGAGPIGVEAAVLAAQQGHDVQVFERGEVGEHVLRWGHVTFFSPWSLNRSAWGEAALREAGEALEDADAFPTGAAYVSAYLQKLADLPLLAGRVHTQTEVLGVARPHVLKGEAIGTPERGAAPFTALVRDAQGARYVSADVVIDTTGSYGDPAGVGVGGLPAIGADALASRIERYIPDPTGADRDTYAGRATLVIGAGYSAVTTLRQLTDLIGDAPDTRVTWLIADTSGAGEEPFTVLADDPLPQRAALAAFGNEAARGAVPGVEPLRGGFVEAIAEGDDGALAVTIRKGDAHHTIHVDQVVANVGYRPDHSITRELQVHLCYASEGPMKLAASLLAAGGGGGDCLQQTGGGFDVLRNPEPDLFILGAKSYGRGSAFLIRLGLEQLADVMDHLAAT